MTVIKSVLYRPGTTKSCKIIVFKNNFARINSDLSIDFFLLFNFERIFKKSHRYPFYYSDRAEVLYATFAHRLVYLLFRNHYNVEF